MVNLVEIIRELILEDVKPAPKLNTWFMKAYENAYIELLQHNQ